MKIFLNILLALPRLFVSLFVFIYHKAIQFIRQVVRIILLPWSKKLEGTKIHTWANKDEPEDPEEKAALKVYRICRFIILILFAGLTVICILIFGNPLLRAQSSLRYLKESGFFVIGNWADPETAVTPEISNAMEDEFQAILANIKDFWFYFQAWVGALFNEDIAKEWGHDFLVKGTDLLKIIDWIPAIAIMIYLFGQAFTKPHPEEEIGPSRALVYWNETIVPKIVRPTQNAFRTFFHFCAETPWVKRLFLFIIGFCCIIGWTAVDTVTSYLLMVLTFDFSWFPTYIASIFVDVVVFFVKVGIPGSIIVWSLIGIATMKKIAVARLSQMQGNNEEIAASLPNITAINGPVGSGKTTMQSSLAIDIESMTRDRCLSMMKKYAAAFPKFDWRKLEAWVALSSSPEEKPEPGETPKKARTFILKTRAQIRAALWFLWKQYEKSDFNPVLSNGHESFFGYDASRGLIWNDGAKEITLLKAVQTYAECFFLYYSGHKLATSNYPIAFPGERQGDFFPVYAPSSSFIHTSGPSETVRFSHVMDMDFFRISNPVEATSVLKNASIDGGVVSMTEGSNERGNRFDYVGQKKSDNEANPLNDGWNKAMRLIRHWFTIDGIPMVKFIYDYQRGDSMNAETRDSAEDTITIMQRSEEDNVLPFWAIDDFICSAVETWWTNYYYYTWKPNRGKDTLLNAFLQWICNKFINHRQRMRYRYGYETIVFNREHGGMNGLTGRRTMEQYYSIFRRTRGELFNTAVYGPILEQPAIIADQGWMDRKEYKSVDATSEEFASQHSYFIKAIANLFDPKKTKEAMRKLNESQTMGSDTPFIDGSEE